MKFLIDTHVLLWWLFADERLSTRADAVLRDPQNAIVVSSATAWEIAIKHRAGRLDSAAPLVADYAGWVARARFEELPITSTHAVRAGSWGVAHRDPVDRMLAAQAETERVRLVTRDPAFEAFPVDTIW